MRVGFIGLGNLGGQLALRIAEAGFELVVQDRSTDATAPLTAAGAHVASTPAELAAAVDCAITCLPSPAAVEAVVAGEDGLLTGLAPGATWIDSSTNDAHLLAKLAAAAAARGVATLECPVTGGVHRAAAGQITALVGGDGGVLERCRPVIEAFSGRVIHVGPLGSASVIKVITNMLAFVHLVADGEALMLARRAGLDLGTSYEAIAASSGNSFVHETEGQLILNGSYDVGFTMDLALKDLGLTLGLAELHGVPLELATHVQQIFVRGRDAYGGGAQSTQIVKLLEDALGTDLRAPGFPARLDPA